MELNKIHNMDCLEGVKQFSRIRPGVWPEAEITHFRPFVGDLQHFIPFAGFAFRHFTFPQSG